MIKELRDPGLRRCGRRQLGDSWASRIATGSPKRPPGGGLRNRLSSSRNGSIGRSSGRQVVSRRAVKKENLTKEDSVSIMCISGEFAAKYGDGRLSWWNLEVACDRDGDECA
jgi:hypothetical protein